MKISQYAPKLILFAFFLASPILSFADFSGNGTWSGQLQFDPRTDGTSWGYTGSSGVASVTVTSTPTSLTLSFNDLTVSYVGFFGQHSVTFDRNGSDLLMNQVKVGTITDQGFSIDLSIGFPTPLNQDTWSKFVFKQIDPKTAQFSERHELLTINSGLLEETSLDGFGKLLKQ